MATKEYAVIVVGAGPAGAAAALCAARAGLGRVLVLEKGREVRDKPCAGGISPVAVRLLRELGLFDRLSAEARRLTGLRLRAPSGREVAFSGDDEAFVLPRTRLHQVMDQALRDASVELRLGCRVQSVHLGRSRLLVVRGADGQEWVARAVVVAAGGRHRVAGVRTYSRRVDTCVVRADGVMCQPETVEMAYHRELLPYYGWLFPHPDGKASLGVAIEAEKRRGRNITILFREVMRWHLGERFTPHANSIRPVAAPVRIFRDALPDAPPGVLVVGEAAGFVSPMTLEGIGFALESGMLAGRALAWAPSADPHRITRLYLEMVQDSILPRLRLHARLARGMGPMVEALGFLLPVPVVGQLIGKSMASV